MNGLKVLTLAPALLLASCSAPEPNRPSTPPLAKATPTPEAAPAVRTPFFAPALTSEGYRKHVAERVAQASPLVFADPLPKMLKSIVVVDITIERDGRLSAVSIRRSNGYKDLENAAMNSVKNAGPFSAPPASMRRKDGSANFLETFLFRDDGRFQVRTLAGVQ